MPKMLDFELHYVLRMCYQQTITISLSVYLQASIEHAKQMRYCGRGDCIVALHRIGNASVIKIVDIK